MIDLLNYSDSPTLATQPLRVLVVSHPSPGWGAQLHLLGFADRLRARGVELTLLCPDGNRLAEEWDASGFRRLSLPHRHHGALRRGPLDDRRPGPRALAGEAATVALSVKRLVPLLRGWDVVHSFSLNAHPEVVAAGRLARVPVIVDVVNIVRPGVGRTVLRAASRIGRLTIVNSRATASTLGEGHRQRVEVVYPAIDLDRFTPGPADPSVRSSLGVPDSVPLVGLVGRIDRDKRVDVMIRAMAQLQGAARQAVLVLVGDRGTGSQQYTDEVIELGRQLLGDRFVVTGRRSEIPEIMRCLDVMASSSVHEPFGLTVLEAMAAGRAVIVTNAGGPPEFVTDGVTGLVVAPENVEELANGLQRLLDDPALRDRLGQAAQTAVRPAFGLDAEAERLTQLYRSVAR
jgi:glycosyltransferase involved in cell wall biosynthesis